MIFDFLHVEEKGGALWRQIYRQIAEAADSGKLAPQSKLPSIRELAAWLGVSRSPVENAYDRLGLDGYIESRSRSGCFVAPRRRAEHSGAAVRDVSGRGIKYDFSPGRIDARSADVAAWRRCLRSALNREAEIVSLGDPCGEPELREQLAAYAYRARGVRCGAGGIITASGTQQLLSLLCRALGRAGQAAIESPGFEQGERVLRDYGWHISIIDESQDTAGLLGEADIFVEIGSKRSESSVSQRARRRRALAAWARSRGSLIIEDDYNGELRYLTRPIPAMQPLAPEHVVYIGSFSHLLLPSVRIAYMALPERLAECCASAARSYDPTSSKVEQLALADYIREGCLEKHLRRCRKIYLRKSRLLAAAIERSFGSALKRRLLETSLSFAVSCRGAADEMKRAALGCGVGVGCDGGEILLSFAGIPDEEIEHAVSSLRRAWDGMLPAFPAAERGRRNE